MEQKKIIEKMLEELSNNQFGLTIEDLSNKTGFHRNTVSKYLNILESFGLVKKRKIGKYTFWYLQEIYYYKEKQFNHIYFEEILKFLDSFGCKFINSFRLGKWLGEAVQRRFNVKKRWFIDMLIHKERYKMYREYIEGIYIPIYQPGVSLKINNMLMDSDYLDISIKSALLKNSEIVEAIINFFIGFLEGFLRYHGIPFKGIKLLRFDNEGGCIILRIKLIDRISNLLKLIKIEFEIDH